MDLHIYFHGDQEALGLLRGINARLTSMSQDIANVLQKEGQLMSALDDGLTQLTAQVTALQTTDDSAIALLNGIQAIIAKAVQDALAAGATPAQLKAITDANAAIAAKNQALADAVKANTPAA